MITIFFMTFSILLRIVGDETIFWMSKGKERKILSVSSCGSWGMKHAIADYIKERVIAFSILLRIVGDETAGQVHTDLTMTTFQYPLADRGG